MRDLDTVQGRRLALADAADQLHALQPGQLVELRRPRYPVVRMLVSDALHETPDANGGSTVAVDLTYGLTGPGGPGPIVAVRAEDLALYGWQLHALAGS